MGLHDSGAVALSYPAPFPSQLQGLDSLLVGVGYLLHRRSLSVLVLANTVNPLHAPRDSRNQLDGMYLYASIEKVWGSITHENIMTKQRKQQTSKVYNQDQPSVALLHL